MLHKIYSNKLACCVIDTPVALLIINSSTEILAHVYMCTPWEHLHVIALYIDINVLQKHEERSVSWGKRNHVTLFQTIFHVSASRNNS